MITGDQIDEIGRIRSDTGQATVRSGRQQPRPGPERFDVVRAKIATDLAGLLILLSMVVGSLIALG